MCVYIYIYIQVDSCRISHRARRHCSIRFVGVHIYVCVCIYSEFRWISPWHCSIRFVGVRVCVCVLYIIVYTCRQHPVRECGCRWILSACMCTYMSDEYIHVCMRHGTHLGWDIRMTHSDTLQHAATRCNTLHHTTLQHTTPHCNTLQHSATQCNALQHTATHCNTLQHTATHYRKQ